MRVLLAGRVKLTTSRTCPAVRECAQLRPSFAMAGGSVARLFPAHRPIMVPGPEFHSTAWTGSDGGGMRPADPSGKADRTIGPLL